MTVPKFHKGEMKTQKKSKMGNPLHESVVSLRQSKRQEKRRKKREMKVQEKVGDVVISSSEEVGEKAEVERKIVALQRIVPGGESFGVDKLFEETAGYILALQCQIKAMRVLASFLEGLEKENRKFGG